MYVEDIVDDDDDDDDDNNHDNDMMTLLRFTIGITRVHVRV